MKKLGIYVCIGVWGALSILFLLFLSTIIFSVSSRERFLATTTSNHQQDLSTTKREYQLLRYELKSDETTSGIISMSDFDMLSPGEYISSSSNDDNTYTLISNFGEEEYFCIGTCYCSEFDDNRRTSTTIIKKGLIYLVASMSSYFALKLAEEHFSRECIEQEQQQNCPSGTRIHSEVDYCEEKETSNRHLQSEKEEARSPTIKKKGRKFEKKWGQYSSGVKVTKKHKTPQWKLDKEAKKAHGGKKIANRDPNYVFYRCSGTCITKKKFESSEARRQAGKFGCDKLRYDQQIRVTGRVMRGGAMTKLPGENLKATAVQIMNHRMTPFCKEKSRFKYSVQEDIDKKKTFVRTAFACTSRPWARGLNPTITCREMV